MEALAAKLPPHITLRPFDDRRPLIAQVADIDVLILGHQRVTAEVFAAARSLRLIQQHGRGVDGVDLAHAARAGVIVANVPGGNSVAVAEHTLALMLFLARRFSRFPAAVSAGLTGTPAGIQLAGKTLAIVGLGAAGAELARIARALRMRVLAIKANPRPEDAQVVDFLGGPEALVNVLAQADFVALLASLTAATRHMIGPAQLARMKPSAYLINTGRAALVDRNALFSALQQSAIAGAAFDVFWDEPAPPSDPLLALDNFFLSPHVAGFTDVSISHVTDVIAENLRRLSVGEPLLNVVGA
jgi:phosphoglycerate dehydrogenase-like enzyme